LCETLYTERRIHLLADRLEVYLQSILSPGTRKTYRQGIESLLNKYPSPTAYDVREWVQEQRDSGLSETTINTKLAAFKSYLKFVRTKEALDLYEEVSLIKVKSVRPPVFVPSDSDVEAALEQAAKHSHTDYLLLCLLVDLGLRANEAITITVGRVDLRGRDTEIEVLRKGGYLQRLPVTERVEKALETRLSVLGKCSPNTKILPWAYTTAWKIVKRYFPDDKRIHPHTLRHVAGTRMQRDYHDVFITQQLLGHKNVQTTQIYAHLADDTLKKALRREVI
jgi:integrase